jgi:hypothetical protein
VREVMMVWRVDDSRQRRVAIAGIAVVVLLFVPLSADCQIPVLGKGFVLDPAGSITLAAAEVISGRASIKGSYFGAGSFTPVIHTDGAFVQFRPNQTYKATLRYRILTAPSRGFEVLFYSPEASRAGNFLPSVTFTGSTGDTGTATLTVRLGPYTDYEAGVKVVGTNVLFPAGIPTVRHSPLTLFPDVNGDGLKDIVFADAGLDRPPWTGSRIGVGLNLGTGRYVDVSPLIPPAQQATRSYSVATGDLDGDGRIEIILPDNDGGNTALLRWNGNGFHAQTNWIDRALWWHPTNLNRQNWLIASDVDGDGQQDLVVGGHTDAPNLRIAFGRGGSFSPSEMVQLPDGPFAPRPRDPTRPINLQADVGPMLVEDFNNDGRLDILALEEQMFEYAPGVITDRNEPGFETIFANGGVVYADIALQVLMNQGGRRFVDVSRASTLQVLGRRSYEELLAIDVNLDGFKDAVGVYVTKGYGSERGFSFGTTIFLNNGTGAFVVIDGTQVLPVVTTTPSNGRHWQLGGFLPTLVTPARIEGVIIESANGTLRIYKTVTNLAGEFRNALASYLDASARQR